MEENIFPSIRPWMTGSSLPDQAAYNDREQLRENGQILVCGSLRRSQKSPSSCTDYSSATISQLDYHNIPDPEDIRASSVAKRSRSDAVDTSLGSQYQSPRKTKGKHLLHPKLVLETTATQTFKVGSPDMFLRAATSSQSRSSSWVRRRLASTSTMIPDAKLCQQSLLSAGVELAAPSSRPDDKMNTVNFDIKPRKSSANEYCEGNFDDSGDGFMRNPRFFYQQIDPQNPGSEESGVKGKYTCAESSDLSRSFGSSNDPTPTHASSDKRQETKDLEYPCGDGEEVMSERKPCTRVLRAKKGRRARVHNLSKRRRRERINGKMRVLRELIPNCNKADNASMLEDVIEYLKTLQLHLQIMLLESRICGFRSIAPSVFCAGLQNVNNIAPKWTHSSVMGMRECTGVGAPFSILPQLGGGYRMPMGYPGRMIIPMPTSPAPLNPMFGGTCVQSLPRTMENV